jgi:hypothetical protein
MKESEDWLSLFYVALTGLSDPSPEKPCKVDETMSEDMKNHFDIWWLSEKGHPPTPAEMADYEEARMLWGKLWSNHPQAQAAEEAEYEDPIEAMTSEQRRELIQKLKALEGLDDDDD